MLRRILVIAVGIATLVVPASTALGAPASSPAPPLDAIRPIPGGKAPPPLSELGGAPVPSYVHPSVPLQPGMRPPTGPPVPGTLPSNEANQAKPGQLQPAYPETWPSGTAAERKAKQDAISAQVTSGAWMWPDGCGAPIGPWNGMSFQMCDHPVQPYPLDRTYRVLRYRLYVYTPTTAVKTIWHITATVRDGSWAVGPQFGPDSITGPHQWILQDGFTRCDNANYTQTAGTIWSGYNYWSPWFYGKTFSRYQCYNGDGHSPS